MVLDLACCILLLSKVWNDYLTTLALWFENSLKLDSDHLNRLYYGLLLFPCQNVWNMLIKSQVLKVYFYLVKCHIMFIWCIARRSKGSIFLCNLLSFLWTCIVWRGYIALYSFIFLRGLDYKETIIDCYSVRLNTLWLFCTNSYNFPDYLWYFFITVLFLISILFEIVLLWRVGVV